MAAMDPIATKYLYFLTDKDGAMHYAETLEEHESNATRYLH
jgi:cell division protein YceG involved in septum cleavage